MLNMMKPAILGMFLAVGFIAAQSLVAQKPAPTPQSAAVVAPVPAQILTARKVFISNVGGDNDISPDHYSGSPNRAYDQFYAAMKSWGHYDLVSTPAEAELVFELHFDVPVYGSGFTDTWRRPQFRLVIMDAKTHFVLWGFTEYLVTMSHVTHDQSFDRAMVALVNDVAKLAGQPPAIVVEEPKKKQAAQVNDSDKGPSPY